MEGEIKTEEAGIKTNDTVPEEPVIINWNRIFGIILLLPPLISVLLFFYQFTVKYSSDSPLENFDNGAAWTGGMGESGGYTSALPIYFGLMAIAGAILLNNSNKKN